jgi:hypothetical protein
VLFGRQWHRVSAAAEGAPALAASKFFAAHSTVKKKQMPLAFTTLPVKKRPRKIRRFSGVVNYKNNSSA